MSLALTWYDWFKTGHVLAAVLWVGGGTTIGIYAFLTQRQDSPEEMASLARKGGPDRGTLVHAVVAPRPRVRLRADGERLQPLDL